MCIRDRLLRAMAKDPLADQWEVVELPAIFDDGKPCWPEYWSLEDLTAVKASIPPSKWNAQYQQKPTGEENAIIPRFAVRFSWQGPPDIGSICAVYAPVFAVFAPRTGVCATGAWAMFLTNNHVENTFGLR